MSAMLTMLMGLVPVPNRLNCLTQQQEFLQILKWSLHWQQLFFEVSILYIGRLIKLPIYKEREESNICIDLFCNPSQHLLFQKPATGKLEKIAKYVRI